MWALGQLGFGLCQRGFGRCQRVFGGLQVVIADNILCVQFGLAVDGQLGSGHIGFGYLHGGLGGLYRLLVRHGVDQEQRLSLVYHCSFVHAKFGDVTAHARTDLDILLPFDRSGIRAVELLTRRFNSHYSQRERGHASLLRISAGERQQSGQRVRCAFHESPDGFPFLHFFHMLTNKLIIIV